MHITNTGWLVVGAMALAVLYVVIEQKLRRIKQRAYDAGWVDREIEALNQDRARRDEKTGRFIAIRGRGQRDVKPSNQGALL